MFVENIYNMNETEIMLFMFNSVKILVNKKNTRNYKNNYVKRESVTVIKCINVDDKYLNSLIIWSVIIYRSN